MNQIVTDDIEDIAVGAGELVLENGGETYRTEDTVVHVAEALGAVNPSAFVTPTVILLSMQDADGKHHTYMRRIFKRTTNLAKLSQVNALSRRLEVRTKNTDPAQVKRILHRIDSIAGYNDYIIILMAALSSAFFTLMFDGSITDAICSFWIGGILRILLILLGMTRFGRDSFMMSLFSGAVLSVMADLCILLPWVSDSSLILLGAIMQVVPGLALVNGIRDIIHGDLVSGGARLLDACMTAIGLSAGSAAGILVLKVL